MLARMSGVSLSVSQRQSGRQLERQSCQALPALESPERSGRLLMAAICCSENT